MTGNMPSRSGYKRLFGGLSYSEVQGNCYLDPLHSFKKAGSYLALPFVWCFYIVYALITDTVTGLLDDVIWARLYQACAGHGKGEKITMAGARVML